MQNKAFIFDNEGPIFKRPVMWRDLHEAYGTTHVISEVFFPDVKKIGYKAAFEGRYAQTWTGKDSRIFQEMILNREYTDGIHELIDRIKSKEGYTVIISTGPIQLAQRAQNDHGIDEIFANELYIDENGIFTGKAKATVDDHNKYEIAEPFHQKFEIIMAIGDGNADRKLVNDSANHTLIAYNAKKNSDDLLARADYNIADGHLRDCLKLI